MDRGDTAPVANVVLTASHLSTRYKIQVRLYGALSLFQFCKFRQPTSPVSLPTQGYGKFAGALNNAPAWEIGKFKGCRRSVVWQKRF
jgi:hypothetical protein